MAIAALRVTAPMSASPRPATRVARRLPPGVVEALLAAKEANPQLSVQLVIRAVRQRPAVPPDRPLPPSTVHRLLARHGLMDTAKTAGQAQDRRRFAFEQAGELWMSDVMHGPAVVVGERVKRKTDLLAFIDDATRVIPYARFALSENTRTFLPVLAQAILRRGLVHKLYVDNGANYRSKQLALVCAKLGIALTHARPYQPQGKGKIERWFKTVRAQPLTRLTEADLASLTALNRRLAGWIEGESHHTPHRGLDGATPLEQWARTGAGVRFPEPGLNLADLFLHEAVRKVQKDHTVSPALRSGRTARTADSGLLRGPGARPGTSGPDVCELLRQTRSPLAHLGRGRPGPRARTLDAAARLPASGR